MFKMTARTGFFLTLIASLVLFGDTCPRDTGGSQEDGLVECIAWCDGVSNCVACSATSGCGPNYKNAGPGQYGWHPCRKENDMGGRASESNRRECMRYCEENSERCDICSTLSNCGPNFYNMEDFKAVWARNWHACEDTRLNDTDTEYSLATIERGTVSIPSHTRPQFR